MSEEQMIVVLIILVGALYLCWNGRPSQQQKRREHFNHLIEQHKRSRDE